MKKYYLNRKRYNYEFQEVLIMCFVDYDRRSFEG